MQQEETAELGPKSLFPWTKDNWNKFSQQKRRGRPSSKQCSLPEALDEAKSLSRELGLPDWEQAEQAAEDDSDEEPPPTACAHCKKSDYTTDYGPR